MPWIAGPSLPDPSGLIAGTLTAQSGSCRALFVGQVGLGPAGAALIDAATPAAIVIAQPEASIRCAGPTLCTLADCRAFLYMQIGVAGGED